MKSPVSALVIVSSVLLLFTTMPGTVVFADPSSGVIEAKPSVCDVGPAELADQLSEIVAIPGFQLTRRVIERISGVRLETDGLVSPGLVLSGTNMGKNIFLFSERHLACVCRRNRWSNLLYMQDGNCITPHALFLCRRATPIPEANMALFVLILTAVPTA